MSWSLRTTGLEMVDLNLPEDDLLATSIVLHALGTGELPIGR